MERQKISSTSIKSMGFDNGVLEVEFKSGGVYQYKGVPMETYQKLRISDSIGSSFSSDVIKKGYTFEKVL
jgi:hypothetical protein